MDKNTLKNGLYILICIIIAIILYNIWSFNIDDIYNNPKIHNTTNVEVVENFDIVSELTKLAQSQKYNLLHIPKVMDESSNTVSIQFDGENKKFVKQIFVIVEDEDDGIGGSVKRSIPLDLQIIVKDGEVEKYVNMAKYKLITDSSSGSFYSGKSMNFINLTDLQGELVQGNMVILKSDTYKFKFANIYVFGNNSGVDYVPLGGERDITTDLDIDEDIGSITALTPYLISKVEFVSNDDIEGFENIENFKAGDRIKKKVDRIKKVAERKKQLRSVKSVLNYKITNSTPLINDIENVINYYKAQLKVIELKKIGDRNVKKDTLRRLDNELEIIKSKIIIQVFPNIEDAEKKLITNGIFDLIDRVNVDYLGKIKQGKLSARAKLLSKKEWDEQKSGVLEPLLNSGTGALTRFKTEYADLLRELASSEDTGVQQVTTATKSQSITETIAKSAEEESSSGEVAVELISSDTFKNIEGFANPNMYNSSDIILSPATTTYYFEEPVLVMTDLTEITINIPGYSIAKIYGKPATNNDIQNFKFANGLISFRDSLNPDTVLGGRAVLDKVGSSMEILDVLDYQKKINSQLKQLDLNKHNIRDLYNQKLDIINTIKKIDRISNNYLKQVQDADAHNAKKFTETIELLQYLKSELEKQAKLQKTRFDINLHL